MMEGEGKEDDRSSRLAITIGRRRRRRTLCFGIFLLLEVRRCSPLVINGSNPFARACTEIMAAFNYMIENVPVIFGLHDSQGWELTMVESSLAH